MSATDRMTPDVTIGLPVRNGGDGLERAIQSLLGQTYRNFVLVISDNDSQDEGVTEAICRRYAAADSRIRYIRQPVNLGNQGNFRFTLMQGETPYFMWAAHDDIWSPTFIEKTRAVLEAHPHASACSPMICIEVPGEPGVISADTFPITGAPVARLKTFFWKIGDCSRFYALHRTEVLQRSYPKDIMVFGFDWVVCALSLVEGEHLEVGEVLLHRRGQVQDHYFRTLLRYAKNPVDRAFPYRPLTLALHRHLPPAGWRACRSLILRLNLIQCLYLLAYRMPWLKVVVKTISKVEGGLRARQTPARSTA